MDYQLDERGPAYEGYCAMEENGRPLSVVFWEEVLDHQPNQNNLAETSVCLASDGSGSKKFYTNIDKTEGSDWYRGASTKVPRASGSN